MIVMEDTVGKRVQGTFPRRGKSFVLILMINDDDPLVYPSSSLFPLSTNTDIEYNSNEDQRTRPIKILPHVFPYDSTFVTKPRRF